MSVKVLLLVAAIAVSCMEGGTSGLPENQLLPPAPVVTSASSQYFERIFSRLLVMPPVLEAPVFNPALPRQPGFQPSINTQEENPTDVSNVAFAVATAQAAPVSTLLLPPFPFTQPQTIAFIAPVPPINVQDPATSERDIEPTTERQNSNLELEETTALPSTAATDYKQGLPSDDNVSFRQYLPPAPQKEKTSVEVVPVPLTYFTPPPPTRFRQTTKHIYIPAKTKITIIPSPPQLGLHVPARIIIHKIPKKFSFLAKYLPKKIVKHLHFVVPASSNSNIAGNNGGASYSYDKPSSGLKLPQ